MQINWFNHRVLSLASVFIASSQSVVNIPFANAQSADQKPLIKAAEWGTPTYKSIGVPTALASCQYAANQNQLKNVVPLISPHTNKVFAARCEIDKKGNPITYVQCNPLNVYIYSGGLNGVCILASRFAEVQVHVDDSPTADTFRGSPGVADVYVMTPKGGINNSITDFELGRDRIVFNGFSKKHLPYGRGSSSGQTRTDLQVGGGLVVSVYGQVPQLGPSTFDFTNPVAR